MELCEIIQDWACLAPIIAELLRTPLQVQLQLTLVAEVVGHFDSHDLGVASRMFLGQPSSLSRSFSECLKLLLVTSRRFNRLFTAAVDSGTAHRCLLAAPAL
jgi:hypothetical protein